MPRRALLYLLPGLLLISALAWTQSERILKARNDFLQLWVGANLIGTPALYNVAANEAMQRQAIGVRLEGVYYCRPPFYAWVLKPLGHMPYLAAYAVFQAISLASLGGFLWLYLPRMPELGLYCSLSLPLLCVFAQGQDVTLVLLFVGASLVLLGKKKDFAAGVILSLCAIKFHLFLLIPLVLLIHRRWRAVAGGIAGGTALVALSFFAAGPHWMAAYLPMLTNPDLNPETGHMPNLRGLLFALGVATPMAEALLGVTIASAVCWIARRSVEIEMPFAYALIGGLLVSHHSYAQDCALLLLSFAILAREAEPRAVRHLMALAMLPPVYLFLMAGAPYNAAVPLLLIAILGVAAAGAWLPGNARPATPLLQNM